MIFLIGNRARCTLNKEILDLHSMRKAFPECSVVELVYKFDEKSTASVRKGKTTSKVPFKLFFGHI